MLKRMIWLVLAAAAVTAAHAATPTVRPESVGLSTARPLLAGVNPRATFSALLQERLPVYRSVARHEVATDNVSPDDFV